MRLPAALAILIATTPAAFAGEGFDLVIPGRPGVPIIQNGIDISYAVVEGDFGLGKGVHNQPTIFGGRYIDPTPYVGHYYPSLGHGAKPGYGRLEIEPPANRKLPQPAEILSSVLVGALGPATPATGTAGGAALSSAGDPRAARWAGANSAGFLKPAARFPKIELRQNNQETA